MRWNIRPIVLLVSATFWERNTPLWIVALFLVMFVLVNLGSGWEHVIYGRGKMEPKDCAPDYRMKQKFFFKSFESGKRIILTTPAAIFRTFIL